MMLLTSILHIAIFSFATCQLLVLPSPAFSVADAPIDNNECTKRCTMPFLNIASTSGTSSMSQISDGFVEMKECVLDCPGGAEIMKLVAGLVPQWFKLFTEMYQGEGTTSTLNPDVMSGVLNEAAGMEQLDDCVTGCERNLQTMMIGGVDALPGLTRLCKMWGMYRQCLTGCPEGVEMLTSVQKMMSSIFKTIEDSCSKVSLTVPSDTTYIRVELNVDRTADTKIIELAIGNTRHSDATENTDSTYATDTTDATEATDTTGVTEATEATDATYATETTGFSKGTDPTDTTEATDTTGATEATDTAGTTEATDTTGATEYIDSTETTDATDNTGVGTVNGRLSIHSESTVGHTNAISFSKVTMDSSDSCAGKCLFELDILRVRSKIENLCDAWISMHTCLWECNFDASVAVTMLRDFHSIMPKTVDYLTTNCNAGNNSFINTDYQNWQKFWAEEQTTDEKELCVQDCEIPVEPFLGFDLVTNCLRIAAYKNCTNRCTGGVAAFNMINRKIPEIVVFVEEICSPYLQSMTGPSEITEDFSREDSTDLWSNVVKASKLLEEDDAVQGHMGTLPSEGEMMVDLEKIFRDRKLPVPQNQVFNFNLEDPTSGAPGVHLGWVPPLIGCFVLALYSLH